MTWQPRSNWRSDHPPACTCARCQRDSGGQRRIDEADRRGTADAAQDIHTPRPPPRPSLSTRNAKGFLSGFFGTLAGILLVSLIGYMIYLYESGGLGQLFTAQANSGGGVHVHAHAHAHIHVAAYTRSITQIPTNVGVAVLYPDPRRCLPPRLRCRS